MASGDENNEFEATPGTVSVDVDLDLDVLEEYEDPTFVSGGPKEEAEGERGGGNDESGPPGLELPDDLDELAPPLELALPLETDPPEENEVALDSLDIEPADSFDLDLDDDTPAPSSATAPEPPVEAEQEVALDSLDIEPADSFDLDLADDAAVPGEQPVEASEEVSLESIDMDLSGEPSAATESVPREEDSESGDFFELGPSGNTGIVTRPAELSHSESDFVELGPSGNTGLSERPAELLIAKAEAGPVDADKAVLTAEESEDVAVEDSSLHAQPEDAAHEEDSQEDVAPEDSSVHAEPEDDVESAKAESTEGESEVAESDGAQEIVAEDQGDSEPAGLPEDSGDSVEILAEDSVEEISPEELVEAESGPTPAVAAGKQRAPEAARERAPTAPPPPIPSVPAVPSTPPAENPWPIPQQSALVRLLESRENHDHTTQAEHLAKQLEIAQDPARIGELAYELGEICERHLGDEGRAVKAYGRSLQADPSLRANLWAIRRIFYSKELWPNLCKLIGAEIRFARDDRDRAELLVERGFVELHRMKDAPQAVETFGEALRLVPALGSAAVGLERSARIVGDSVALIQALEAREELSQSAEEKALCAVELAREYRQTGRIDDAAQLLGKVATWNVFSHRVAREQEWLAGAQHDRAGYISALETRIGHFLRRVEDANAESHDESLRIVAEVVALRRAQAQEVWSEDNPDEAWHFLQEALVLAPKDELVLADLSELAERSGRFADLAGLIEAREADESDPERALALALTRARALQMSDRGDVAEELLRARSLSRPGYLPILVAREIQACRDGNWVLAARLCAELAESLAEGSYLREGAKADVEAASEAFHSAIDLLALAGQNAGDDDPDGANHRELALGYAQRAAAIRRTHFPTQLHLALVMARAGRAEEGAKAMEDFCAEGGTEDSPDGALSDGALPDGALPDERLRALQVAAQLYSQCGMPEDELRCAKAALALQPSVLMYGRIDGILRDLGKRSERAQHLEAWATSAEDAEEKAALFQSAAGLYASSEQGDDESQDAVLRCLRACLAIDDSNRQAREALWASLAQRELWKELVDDVTDLWRSGQLADTELGASLPRRIVDVLELCVQDSTSALAFCKECLEREPERVEIRLRAIQLRESESEADWGALAADWLALSEYAADDLSLHSFATWQAYRAFAKADNVAAARTALVDAHEAGVTAATLALLWQNAEEGEREQREALEQQLCAKLGGEEAEEELANWRSIASLWRNDSSMLALSESGEGQGSPERALALTLSLAKEYSPKEQGDALALLAEELQWEAASAALLVRAALLAEVAGDREVAQDRLAIALAGATLDEALVMVASERMESPDASSELSEFELQNRLELCRARRSMSNPGLGQDDWAVREAEVLERLGKLQDAQAIIEDVLGRRPKHLRSLRVFRRICLRGGNQRGVADALCTISSVLTSPEVRLAHLREAARIYDSELGLVDESIATYLAICELDLEGEEFHRACEMLREAGQRRELYRLLSKRLQAMEEVGSEPETRESAAALLYERATIRNAVGDWRGAERDCLAALAQNSAHVGAKWELATVLLAKGDAALAAEKMQEVLAGDCDEKLRAECELALSEILANQLGDQEGAIENLVKRIAAEPNDLGLREKIIDLYIRTGQVGLAAEQVRAISGQRASDRERALDHLRLGEAYRRAEDKQAAAAEFLLACELDATNLDALADALKLLGGDDAKRGILLYRAEETVRSALKEEPLRVANYERLLSIAKWTERSELQVQCERALAVLGQGKAPATPTSSPPALRNNEIQKFLAPLDGAVLALWRIGQSAVLSAAKETPSDLGFARAESVSPKEWDAYPEMKALAAAAQVGKVDLYVDENATGKVLLWNDGKAELYAGKKGLQGPGEENDAFDPRHRYAMTSALLHVHLGISSLGAKSEEEFLGMFAAMLSVRDAPLAPEWEEIVADDAKVLAESLSRSVPRKVRKRLTKTDFGGGPTEVRAWFRSHARAMAHLALRAAGGDIVSALASLHTPEGEASQKLREELLLASISEQMIARIGEGL